MAESKTEKQKVQEITEKLEQGIKELFESEKYKTYLNTMSKFHNYSFNNTMLIAMQKPDATLVAGFKAWQKNFDRHVKKGEKGIRILAPAPYKIKEEQEKLDPVTGEIMLDKNGMPITEEVEIKIPAFRVVPVFDVSQTDGKELPDIGVNELSGSVEDYEDFMQALTEVSPVPITYEDIDGDAKGYFHTTDHRIAIQEGMSQSQTVKTAIHEVAHAKLHDREQNQDIDAVLDKDRNTKEVEAESVAYTVCQHFGIDTSDYSFGYIAGWSSDRDMKELKSSLDTIRKTASELITGIEDRLAELQKDRAVEQEQKQELEESPANREEQLLFGSEDRFGIYQLKDTEEARDIHFMGMDYLESKGIAVTRENYDLLYTAPLEEDTSLEDIYTRFNIDRPADFRGHSLSVSDVVVLHQNGENTSHYVDSFGYREVPQFTKELMAEHTQEQTPVIDETAEILSEIAQEHAQDEPDRENEVFLVNYNEWREVSTLDFEQNYFAIDDPYADGDFRLLHLQNQIKDITPAGVHYDTYEEAAAALYEAERETANMPFNKENNIGSYMVNGRAQLERIMEARQLQKHMDIENDKVSYYVIANLSTWAENSPERSKLERFDSISDAMEAFQAYRGKDAQYSDDKARTTFGVSVHGIEFDVIHVRNNENVLSLDFTHSNEAKESKHFMEKTEAVERERLNECIRAESPEVDSVVADFKAKTEQLFNGINGPTQDDIEQTVWAYLQSKIDEYEIDVELVDVVVSGSRCRGLEKADSDLDVVVEYKGREHEDTLFNAFNEDGLMIGGIKVDINPITEGKTGTLATYLPGVESYLAEKQAMQKAPAVEVIPEKTVTLTVAECGEFHSLGEFHENIASVEEAIAVWKSIPPERMNGIPSIGINIHTEGTERYEDVEMDILSGKVIDLEVLDYVPDITDEPKAIEVIAELIDKLPDIEVRGSLEKWQAAILASQIDQLSYDYDTYQYQDTVEDREAQVANITEDIRNGNTGYLNDFLNAVISDGVREGITDIFGQGVEIDDSEAVQTARRAKELLDKLAEYKPLAKVEELTEQNYNIIDNVLNNEAEKKEQEQTKGRISIKEKLAEKKAVIEQRDKAERTSPEKKTEKKSQREM